MSNKIILIAGGAGFLGSHLSDKYLEKGWEVVAVDNLSTGFKRNIKHLTSNPNFTFIEHDICEALPTSLNRKKFAVVANLASPASPPHYQRLANETLEVGSIGTRNMLMLAKRDNARFFHASTSEVYGDPEIHPQPESYKGSVNSYGPRAMYDEAKRYAEALIYVWHEQHGVNTCLARFFNTYGPRMDPDDGRVVSNFVVQALKAKPLTIYGEGSQTRSFCYVDDLIEGIVKLIESDVHEPINLGNPGEFTIKQLAEIVLELTSSKSVLTKLPLPKDDPTQRQPVIDKASKLLNWQPKTPLRQGLQKTIEYFASLTKT